jgi:hypothetical protein
MSLWQRAVCTGLLCRAVQQSTLNWKDATLRMRRLECDVSNVTSRMWRPECDVSAEAQEYSSHRCSGSGEVHFFSRKMDPQWNQGDQMSLSKNRTKCSPTKFWSQLMPLLEKSSRKMSATSVIFQKTAQSKQSQSGHPEWNPVLTRLRGHILIWCAVHTYQVWIGVIRRNKAAALQPNQGCQIFQAQNSKRGKYTKLQRAAPNVHKI